MTSASAPAGRRQLAGTGLLAMGGVALGALYPLSAAALSPVALPIVIVAVTSLFLAWRQPEVGIALAIFLVASPTFGLGSGPGSTSYALLGYVAVIVIAAIHRQRPDVRRLAGGGIGPWLALYLVTGVLSVLNANDSSAAAHVIARLTSASLLALAVTIMVTDRRTLFWVLGPLVAVALAVGMHAVLEYASSRSPSAGFITNAGQLVGRATAGFGQPNQLGGFLVILVPLAVLTASLARRGRAASGVAAALGAFGVYASFSRGALIGLVVIPFVFLRGWRLLLAGPLLVLFAVVAAPAALTERFATLTSSGAELATRADIWRAALAIWERHPVLGVGVGNFPGAYATVPIPGKLYLPNTIFVPPPHAHNVFLNILAEQGLIGFAAFAGVVFVAGRTTLRLRASQDRSYRLIGSALLAALLAFLVHNLFDVTLFDAETGPYVFVLFALVAAAGNLAHGNVPLQALKR